jgi:hypothetical protein
VDGFLADVARAWRLAQEAFREHQSPTAIGLQYRYALVTVSLKSMAQNIYANLLVALVQEGVWTPAQALIYARQLLDHARQAEALVRLAPHLPEPLLRPVLMVVQAIENPEVRAKALAQLAPYLPESLLQAALAEVQAVRDPIVRARALAQLAPHLLKVLLQAASATARRTRNQKTQEGLRAGTPTLAQLTDQNLYDLWQETLSRLTACTRHDFLAYFCALEPVIVALGEGPALVETCHAILDVGRWWP